MTLLYPTPVSLEQRVMDLEQRIKALEDSKTSSKKK